MRVVRHVYSFCRTQAYLERFTELEKEVNRREKELIEKREQGTFERSEAQLTLGVGSIQLNADKSRRIGCKRFGVQVGVNGFTHAHRRPHQRIGGCARYHQAV